MANPRQRRKARSSTQRPVMHSKRANKFLKKMPPIKGPKVLQDAWDRHKTVAQNYAAIGLAHSLSPIEPVNQRIELAHPGRTPGTTTADTGVSGYRRPSQHGRLIRDASGAVVDAEILEEAYGEAVGSGEEAAGRSHGREREQEAERRLGSDHRVLAPGRSAGVEASKVVRALEAEAAGTTRANRSVSRGEAAYIAALVAAHGTDWEKMARDRRVNVQQYSAGQLRRAARRAGVE